MLAKFKYENEYEINSFESKSYDEMHEIQKEKLTPVVYPCPRNKVIINNTLYRTRGYVKV